MRSDTRRNIKRLVWSVGEVVRENPTSVTMNAIAAKAEIAPATAYRYFSSVELLVEAYTVEMVTELGDFGESSDETGSDLYRAVLAQWFELIVEHGRAMVHLRSRRGFLDRLHHEDALIAQVRRAWEHPVRELLAAEGIDASHYEMAMFLCNILTDPREMLDLAEHVDIDRDEAVTALCRTVVGAIRGWAQADAT